MSKTFQFTERPPLLLLEYRPMSSYVHEKLETMGSVTIRRTFTFKKNDLLEPTEPYEFDVDNPEYIFKFGNVESALSRAENFVETKQKTIMAVAAGILVIILAVILYTNFIREPRKKEAWSEAFKAEYYFEIDSFSLALYGDGFYPGFIDIVDEYGSTPMGNAAKYNAGVCFMRIGEFETAIDLLSKGPYDCGLDVKPLHGRADWRLRLGRWRVLFRVDEGRITITVISVAPRGDAYK